MTIRGIAQLAFLVVLTFSCNREAAKIPPAGMPQSTTPASPAPAVIPPSESAGHHPQKETVNQLIRINEKALHYQEQDSLLAARQLYEQALDIITEYEEDESNTFFPDYVRAKNEILKNFRGILTKEGFDIQETDTDILQSEIDILRVIQDAERVDDPEHAVVAPENAVTGAIPRVLNSKVQRWISRFAYGDQRKYFDIWIKRSGKYLPLIQDAVREEGLPEELAYLAMIESGFNPTVQSYARAVGLWQFISATGRKNGLRIDTYVDERRDPVKSTRAALKHLKELYYYWGQDWLLALSAYNVSERRLRRAIQRYKTRDFWRLGWPLPRQTRNYIPKYLAAVEIMQNPQKFGFKLPEPEPYSFENVTIDRQASLDIIARAAGIPESTIRELNSELKLSITPTITPEEPVYTLRLPPGLKDRFLTQFSAIPDNELITSLTYTVKRRDTISGISQMFRVNARDIMAVNSIGNPRRLKIGQKLTIPRPSSGFTPRYIERSLLSASMPEIPPDAGKRRKIAYAVRKNDTLWDISQAHGVTVRNLQAWNKLGRNRYIYPNQKLIVWLPASERAPRDTNSAVTESSRSVHIVRRGDTLSRIGKIYHIPLPDLLAWNNMTTRSKIYPGDKIYLHESDTAGYRTGDSVEETFRYIVRRGDTLWDIAVKFGTTVSRLMMFNKLRTSRIIHPGDMLLIPAMRTGSPQPSSK